MSCQPCGCQKQSEKCQLRNKLWIFIRHCHLQLSIIKNKTSNIWRYSIKYPGKDSRMWKMLTCSFFIFKSLNFALSLGFEPPTSWALKAHGLGSGSYILWLKIHSYCFRWFRHITEPSTNYKSRRNSLIQQSNDDQVMLTV